MPFDVIDTPDFPVSALPAPVAAFVHAISDNTQTPAEMAASVVLGVLASAFQGKYQIAATYNWREPLNLYLLMIADVGDRKSAVLRPMSAPVYEYEAVVRETEKEAVAQNQQKKRLLEKKLAAAEKAAAAPVPNEKSAAAEQMACELARDVANFKEVHPTRLIVDDVTQEALVAIMEEQGGCLTQYSAEGGLFDALKGRYIQSVNIDVYLKSHCGDPLSVHRIGRRSNDIPNPRLTLLLMCQPDVLSGLMTEPTFRGRGLCARFLYTMCRSRVGYRLVGFDAPVIPPDVTEAYNKFILELLYRQDNGVIWLDSDALQLWNQYCKRTEARLVDDLEALRDWGSKLVGAMLRITGLLHAANCENPTETRVTAETISRAIVISEFFAANAIAAYQSMGADSALEDALYLWKRLQSANQLQTTKRDLFNMCKGKFKTVELMEPALERLTAMGYIRITEHKQGGAGRPTIKIDVNPLALKTQTKVDDLNV